MSRNRIPSAPVLYYLAAAISVTLLCLPGLRGTFAFDDFPNIVDNPAVHVTGLSLGSWMDAIWSSPSSSLQRPLSSLSFAMNHYFSGLAPTPMKITNLCIHLVDGLLLLWLLLSALGPPDDACREIDRRNRWLAVITSVAWLLHPINLDPALYVVQRMESLAQLFVLLGLLAYVNGRRRIASSMPWGKCLLWLAVPACLLLGLTAKESAALLPTYALALEFTVLRSVRCPRAMLVLFFLLFLAIPGLFAIIWVLPEILSAGAWSTRAFTLMQRLLTEPRVLVEYAVWTIFPTPGFFSFFHDSYKISTSTLHPWSTLPSIMVIALAAIVAWRVRRTHPISALGLMWFLLAHLLTATVIPLELVFNHRNYFASIGLLLALFDNILPRVPGSTFWLARVTIIFSSIALAAFTTHLRAREWGNPLLFATTEVARHPDSPRAHYELGRQYLILSDYRADSLEYQRALAQLTKAMQLPTSSTLPEAALIMLASRSGTPIDPLWWASITGKLISRPPTVEDIQAIDSLTECQRAGLCAIDDPAMLKIYRTANAWPKQDPKILSDFAIFAENRMQDSELALDLARQAAVLGGPRYQMNLVNFLIDLGRLEEARQELEFLRKRVKPGTMLTIMTAASARIDALTLPSRTPLPSPDG